MYGENVIQKYLIKKANRTRGGTDQKMPFQIISQGNIN
jgi:hypothetical protein